jgi:hypothetical protein
MSCSKKYKECDVTSWDIKTNTIEISIEVFGVEE